MSQSFSAARPVTLKLVQAADERRSLRLEKLGVIAGFLLGLPLALFVVNEVLAEAPEAIEVLAVVGVVAVTTRFGLMAASAVARRLAR